MVARLLQALPDEPSRLAALQDTLRSWSEAFGTRPTLISADGRVLADSHVDPSTMANHGDRPEVRAALASGYGTATRHSDTLGERSLYVAQRLDPAVGDAAIVRVALPLRSVAESVSDVQASVIAAASVASLAIIALSFLLADRSTRPLRALTESVQALPAVEGTALPAGGYDEIQRLGAAFNNMAAEVNAKVSTLAEERNRVEVVLAHLTDGVVITGGDGRVSLINAAAERLLSLSGHTSVIGKPLAEVVGVGNIMLVWERCRESGREHEIMVEMPQKGAFLRVVATPIRGARLSGERHNKLRLAMIVLQDLSQVRRLETVRRDFISNISHELRTPLASLKALVETLQNGALEDPEAAQGFLQRMEIEVDSLAQMVQELLELPRIESGQVPIRQAPVPVRELVKEPLERLRPQAERAGLAMRLDLPPDELVVLADLERTKQVLTNIVHNAIKFTPGGGCITISAARAGSEIVVSVADTGPGIPARDLSRIFERFYKADRARASGGTGLGLATAKHIVQAHGGRVWAESREGQGSIFYFTLPAAR